MTTAWAQDDTGFSADQIAENQGAVAYWYATAYSYVYGVADNWGAIEAAGLPLRGFYSPHTGDAIDFDSELDFEGDMMYVPGDCGGVEIHVRLSSGDIVLPGTLMHSWDCAGPCDPCPKNCMTCCDITICKTECWTVCGQEEAVCKIIDWMMWKSFETFECRYGSRPCGEEEWFASGFAPIDANWRDKAPFMDIEYVWKKGDICVCPCVLQKAYVNCCPPAPACAPCGKTKCGGCDKCKQATCTKCVDKCAKPCCEQKTCNKCDTCKPKCDKPKCGGCDTCKPKCDDKCAKPCCKQKTCTKCETKCEKPKCGGCDKCAKP
jgi:hypothetical protein